MLLLVLLFRPTSPCAAQEKDLEHGLINIGIGSLVGGVGAVINKEPEQRLGKVLLKGLAQGALGGYFVFEGKRLVREFAQEGNTNYLWPSKFVNSAGASIIENAAANRDFWDRWHLTFGFNRIEIDTERNFRFSYRIMPFSLVSTAYGFTQGQLDLGRSLKVGTFVFTSNKESLRENEITYGRALTNSILVKRGLPDQHQVEAHELIHVYQHEGMAGVNTYFDKPMNHLEEQYKIFRAYDRIFYTDFQTLVRGGIYKLEEHMYGYRKVSSEVEAAYFGQNKF